MHKVAKMSNHVEYKYFNNVINVILVEYVLDIFHNLVW